VRLSWQVVEESHEEWVQGVAMWQGASLYGLRWVTSSVSLVGVVCVCGVVCVLCAVRPPPIGGINSYPTKCEFSGIVIFFPALSIWLFYLLLVRPIRPWQSD
jgi:hypothetical protein